MDTSQPIRIDEAPIINVLSKGESDSYVPVYALIYDGIHQMIKSCFGAQEVLFENVLANSEIVRR